MGKFLKGLLKTILFLLVFVIVVGGGYFGYVLLQYYRIEDNQALNNKIYKYTGALNSTTINSSTELSVMTYNIGFGAYDQEYDFFMDTGEMLDGTPVKGHYAKAASKERALRNTNGSMEAVKTANPTFALIQEIDVKSHRCYKINQYDTFMHGLTDYESVYASNFHTAFLAYPFNDMMGKTEAGLATFSKYTINSATRRSYPVDESFPAKLFDLDRAFSVSRFQLSNGKELVIGNSHMSAYDEGGYVKKEQMKFLATFLTEENQKGNYVIIGGDYNQDLCNSAGFYPTEEKVPGWAMPFDTTALPEHYEVYSSLYNQNNEPTPTCRGAEMPYVKGVDFTVVIDGFVVSDNVIVDQVYNIDLDFMYSDHNPAFLKFRLAL